MVTLERRIRTKVELGELEKERINKIKELRLSHYRLLISL